MLRKKELQLAETRFRPSSGKDHGHPSTSWRGAPSRSELFPRASCSSRQQVSHSQQIVNRGRPGEHPFHPLATPVANLAHQADGLHPAEDLFHPLAFLLADDVTGVPRVVR